MQERRRSVAAVRASGPHFEQLFNLICCLFLLTDLIFRCLFILIHLILHSISYLKERIHGTLDQGIPVVIIEIIRTIVYQICQNRPSFIEYIMKTFWPIWQQTDTDA